MPSNTPTVTNPNTPPDQGDMVHSRQTHSPSPVIPPTKPTRASPSPALSHSSTSVAPAASKEMDRDKVQIHDELGPTHQSLSPTETRHSPGSDPLITQAFATYNEAHPQRSGGNRPYYPESTQEPGSHWSQARDGGFMDARDRERYPPSSSSYQSDAPYHSGPAGAWPRAVSPSGSQATHKYLSFTRHGSSARPRSPLPHESRVPLSDAATQRTYPGPSYTETQPSHHSPEVYQTKRHRLDSDSDGYSDQEGRYRHGQTSEPKHHYPAYGEQDHYHAMPYHFADPNSGKPHHHPYNELNRDHRMYPNSSVPPEGLPPLAPRPARHPMDEDPGPAGTHQQYHHHQQQQQQQQQHSQIQQQQQHPHQTHHSQQHRQYNHSSHHQQPHHTQLKKDGGLGSESFKIQSARGTPKGPLPIDVQISLLSSVLKHDPFNCAIRKTTQAWELISREQGIRARTCSRRFDNIIQASIAGRDRPVGTEEQQATKKKLLEELFEMMNQPQALKRMQKKRRYRSEDTDRRLLLETIRLNPFAQKVGQVAKAWEDVRDALNMKVHARQCIRRVNRMVKPYQLRERMYKGNIPDEMKEANDDLVKQVINLMRMAGQGGTLDDACNSNDEDSATGMSESDDQEDTYMHVKGQGHAQEDDELEEDEDDEMMSRSESEQRHVQKTQDEGSRYGAITPSSPKAPALPSPSTQPTTPSGASSALVTSAKRGRPRNPMPSTQSIRPTSRSSLDRTQNQTSAQSADPVARDGEATEPKTLRPGSDNGPDDRVLSSAMQSTPLSSPLPVHSPSASTTFNLTHARHHSQGEYLESSEYRRPFKHARTSSRGVQDLSVETTRSKREESGYRYAARGGPLLDTHGRPILPVSSSALEAAGPSDSMAAPPTAQQYRDVVNELRNMREYLSRMDEHRRAETEKHGSMMYMIEKLQHQMQQQQQQLSQLQHQLRYYAPQSQHVVPPPPPQSPHHSHQQQHQGTLPSSGPTGSRYTATHHSSNSMDGRPVAERHGQDMPHHVSYSRSDAHYSATRDR
ncbi:hypothetical protein EDD11_002861 [Mortierella claussenii]|nr:hypothetical protein EDD11_002861 [Mortierella claussenii]